MQRAAAYLINIDPQGVHCGVPNLVVSRIHENLVEDLVQSGGEGDIFQHHALAVVDPQRLLLLLSASDVSIGTEQDVLQLGKLLVSLLNGFATGIVGCQCGLGRCCLALATLQ